MLIVEGGDNVGMKIMEQVKLILKVKLLPDMEIILEVKIIFGLEIMTEVDNWTCLRSSPELY